MLYETHEEREGAEARRLREGLDRYRDFVRLLCADHGIMVLPMTQECTKAWERIKQWERGHNDKETDTMA